MNGSSGLDVYRTRTSIGSSFDSIPPRNRPIHLRQFAKCLSVIKTVPKISDDGCADDGMSVLLPAAADDDDELAISFNPK